MCLRIKAKEEESIDQVEEKQGQSFVGLGGLCRPLAFSLIKMKRHGVREASRAGPSLTYI